MVQSVIEVACQLFFVMMRTPGGVGMVVAASFLLALRWMIRDKSEDVRTAARS
jgi:hypothetical protein